MRIPTLLALALLAGCSSAPVRSPEELTRSETAADTHYLSDRYAEARPLYAALAQDHPDSTRRTHFRLREAQCLAATRRHVEALGVIDTIRNSTPPPDPTVLARAEAVAGEIHRLSGRDDQARERYAQALQKGPRDIPKDAVLFSLARVCQRLGRWDEARTHLSGLLADFPSSPYRPAASELLDHRHFSIQVGAFRASASALEMAEKLTRAGVPAFMESDRGPEGSLYCVRIGRYRSWPEGNKAREELASRGKVPRDAFLVP